MKLKSKPARQTQALQLTSMAKLRPPQRRIKMVKKTKRKRPRVRYQMLETAVQLTNIPGSRT